MVNGSPSRRRPGADEADLDLRAGDSAELPSDDVLDRGPGGCVSLVDSEDFSDDSDDEIQGPPSVTGKGKEIAPLPRRRRRARRHRHRREARGFMAAARRAHPPVLPASSTSPRRRSPAHPAKALAPPDRDGFFEVRSRRFGRSRSPVCSPRRVPPELEGLCFRCLRAGHVRADCPYPLRCYNCYSENHRAAACPRPVRLAVVGSKRGRSPSGVEVAHKVAHRHSPPTAHSRPDSADTVLGGSASTGRSTSIPACCAESTARDSDPHSPTTQQQPPQPSAPCVEGLQMVR